MQCFHISFRHLGRILFEFGRGEHYQFVAVAHAVEVALEQIMAYNKAEGKSGKSTILLLGRFGFDGDKLEKSGLFEYIDRGNKLRSVKYPKLDITFMTAHASKGLGYDNVIVVNGRNETYGFPSKIEDDPVLAFLHSLQAFPGGLLQKR